MYSKPNVTKLASSIAAIQSNNQKVQASIFDNPNPFETTPMAYEADE
jgi:hypothetical protein